MSESKTDFSGLTTEIVSSFVSANNISASELPALIKSIYGSLTTLGEPSTPVVSETTKATPAQIRKSMSGEKLVSFIDGKGYMSLKRHLATYNHTPASYREAYGLGKEYPMTHPSYSAKRSELAKSTGLGQKGRAAKGAPVKAAPAKRGRKPKAEA